MGHADHEISAAFSRFDCDGNQILDEDEQNRMKIELEEKRVRMTTSLYVKLQATPTFTKSMVVVTKSTFIRSIRS